MATVIVLNGASSSGKTTIARAFQEIAPRIFLNFSIDSILYALPPGAIERIERGADIGDLNLRDLVRAFYTCAGTLLDLGHDLVIDHAITAPYHVDLLHAATARHDAILVGIDCPADVLRGREQQRANRRAGMAEQQRERVHTLLEYDLWIDSSQVTPSEAAELIVQALALRERSRG